MIEDYFKKYIFAICAVELHEKNSTTKSFTISEQQFYRRYNELTLNVEKYKFLAHDEIYKTANASLNIHNNIFVLITEIPMNILLETMYDGQIIPLKLYVDCNNLHKSVIHETHSDQIEFISDMLSIYYLSHTSNTSPLDFEINNLIGDDITKWIYSMENNKRKIKLSSELPSKIIYDGIDNMSLIYDANTHKIKFIPIKYNDIKLNGGVIFTYASDTHMNDFVNLINNTKCKEQENICVENYGKKYEYNYVNKTLIITDDTFMWRNQKLDSSKFELMDINHLLNKQHLNLLSYYLEIYKSVEPIYQEIYENIYNRIFKTCWERIIINVKINNISIKGLYMLAFLKTNNKWIIHDMIDNISCSTNNHIRNIIFIQSSGYVSIDDVTSSNWFLASKIPDIGIHSYNVNRLLNFDEVKLPIKFDEKLKNSEFINQITLKEIISSDHLMNMDNIFNGIPILRDGCVDLIDLKSKAITAFSYGYTELFSINNFTLKGIITTYEAGNLEEKLQFIEISSTMINNIINKWTFLKNALSSNVEFCQICMEDDINFMAISICGHSVCISCFLKISDADEFICNEYRCPFCKEEFEYNPILIPTKNNISSYNSKVNESSQLYVIQQYICKILNNNETQIILVADDCADIVADDFQSRLHIVNNKKLMMQMKWKDLSYITDMIIIKNNKLYRFLHNINKKIQDINNGQFNKIPDMYGSEKDCEHYSYIAMYNALNHRNRKENLRVHFMYDVKDF